VTNKISEAREALENKYVIHRSNEDFRRVAIPEKDFETISDLLTTLSSIDAERLGEAIEHVRKLDREMRHNQVYPPSYTMSVPVNKEEDSDYRIKMVCDAAATLHGLVKGG